MTLGNFMEPRNSIRLVEDLSSIVKDLSRSAENLSISAIGTLKECPKLEDKLI
jgi:hypothetical protein